MRKIVHISDLHFGKENPATVEKLVEAVNEIGPHLTVVSGDLTQRARQSQFAAARVFLDRLPGPRIVVPGNHDVPLYRVAERFAHPLANYKKFITDDLAPFFSDEEIAAAGVNTTRSLSIKGGRINPVQIAEIRDRMSGLAGQILKIVVTHHPFDIPDDGEETDIVGGAQEAVPLIAESGADVFLSGHLHVSRISHSAHRYRLESGRSMLIIQAGTAASVRERGEANSFNLILYEHPLLTVNRFKCTIPSAGFSLETNERFTRTDAGWTRI